MWWKERSGKIRLHQGTSQFKLSTSTFVSLLFELSNRLLYSTPNLIRTNSKLEGFVSLSAPLSMSSVLGSDSLSLCLFLSLYLFVTLYVLLSLTLPTFPPHLFSKESVYLPGDEGWGSGFQYGQMQRGCK